jgi:hypothetical protein
MKFKDVIKNINCKYELEVYDGGKIIRVKRSTKTLINGIIVETPNDMAFYFDSSDNLTQQIGCETMIDEKSIDEFAPKPELVFCIFKKSFSSFFIFSFKSEERMFCSFKGVLYSI